MDVQTPVCDGLEATRHKAGLLAGREKSHVVVIGCSANAQDADIKACLDAGMNDLIAKPIRAPILESTATSNLKLEKGEVSARKPQAKCGDVRFQYQARAQPMSKEVHPERGPAHRSMSSLERQRPNAP